MGSKRSFDDELFHDFSSKHPKLANTTETLKSYISAENDSLYFEDENKYISSHLSDKEVEISAPYSWVTTSSSEEEGVSSSLSTKYPEIEDTYTYSSSIYGTPSIPIPLGPDHQAQLPLFNPISGKNCGFGYDRMMGDCVIPLSTETKIRVGNGRKSCDCPDEGSEKCVSRHVREARERVRADLGPEKFVKLGFCDMGEDVSQLWTRVEENLFKKVVYSNKNFWVNLFEVFPSRTKKEIVSYYFNLFILRRRSIQNRSNFLEIDSDDDEWDVSYCEPLEDDLYVIEKNGATSSGGGFDTSYLMEHSHEKVWDDSFVLSPLRFNEFISTAQMIEELFGGSPDSGSMF